MFKRFLFFLLIILSFLINGMTIDQAIERAYQNNIQIKITKENVNIANDDLSLSLSNFFPKISSSGTFLRLDTVPTTYVNTQIGPMKIKVGEQNNYSLDIKLSQPIFLGGKLILGYMISKDRLQISKYEIEKTKKDIKFSVVQIYLSIKLIDRMIEVNEEILKSSQEHHNIILSKFFYGTSSKLEKLSSDLEIENKKMELNELIKQKDNLLNNLKFILGMDIKDTLSLTDSLSFDLIEKYDTLKLDSLGMDSILKICIENKTDLKELEMTKNIAKKGVILNSSNFLPSVAFFSSYNYKNYYSYISDSSYFDGSYNFGLSVNLDLFSGGSRVLNILKSKKQEKELNMSYLLLKERIPVDIDLMLKNYHNSLQNVEVFEKMVELSQEAYKIAEEQYSRGIISHIDYYDVQTKYMSSKVGYLKSLYDMIINKLSILNYLGIL